MSLGTTQGLDEGPVLAQVLAAVAGMPVHAVVNLGEHLDAADFDAPDNVTLTSYIRHAAVMPHTAVMVNHAGLGSIVAALMHGVPMVSLPLDRDQPHNAERVDALGVGVVLPRDADAGAIRAAIETAMNDPAYREAASRFAVTYDATASRAIAELESHL